jgi:hypothetical protein
MLALPLCSTEQHRSLGRLGHKNERCDRQVPSLEPRGGELVGVRGHSWQFPSDIENFRATKAGIGKPIVRLTVLCHQALTKTMDARLPILGPLMRKRGYQVPIKSEHHFYGVYAQ